MTATLVRAAGVAAGAIAALATSLVGSVPPAAALEPPAEPTITEQPADWPQPPEVGAEAFVLVDAATGQVLAGRDAEVRRPVASTIKVLTAVSAIERVPSDDQVTVGDEVTGVGGASVGLTPGETWSVEELLEGIIARSGNEAAHALATHTAGSVDAFHTMMEQDLEAIGLEGIAVSDVSGLEDSNLLSALDLATLARVALDDQELRPILADPTVSLPGLGVVESRNELLQTYPDATGVKTGYTRAAGYCLVASARRDGRELVAVVLGAGDDPARFEQAAALLDHGFDHYASTQLSASLVFSVAGGRVELDAGPLAVNVPTRAAAGLDVPLQARPPQDAPRVGVLVDDAEVASVTSTLRRVAPEPPAGDATSVGASLVDGAYAALRAGAATGSLR